MQLPDITAIFYLAMFGLFVALILLAVGGALLGYHLTTALLLYLG